MSEHMDEYQIEWHNARAVLLRRLDEDEAWEFINSLRDKGMTLAELNFLHDYVYVTPIHEDDECEKHKPSFEALPLKQSA